MENTNLKIKKIILGLMDPAMQDVDISESINLIDELGFDSISIVNLILEIENVFNIVIDNYDMEQISEYKTLCELVEQIIKEGETT